MKKIILALAILLICAPILDADDDLARAVTDDYDQHLAELFITFHSHPELSFLETETASRLAEELRAAGVEVTNGLPEELLPEVVVSTEYTLPTGNDIELSQRIKNAFIRELGEDSIYERERDGMGAEDFAFFVMTDEKVPGAYFRVGGTPQADLDADAAGGPPVPSHHSPFFKIDPEPSVTMGTRAMVVAILELLGTR